MAGFLTDADIPPLLVRELIGMKHDVLTAKQLGLTSGRGVPAAHDGAVLQAAAERYRVLISHNQRDFLLLHQAWPHWRVTWQGVWPPSTHSGILVFRQVAPPELPRVAQAIDDLSAKQPSLTDRMYAWRQPLWQPLG